MPGQNCIYSERLKINIDYSARKYNWRFNIFNFVAVVVGFAVEFLILSGAIHRPNIRLSIGHGNEHCRQKKIAMNLAKTHIDCVHSDICIEKRDVRIGSAL